MKLKGSSGLAQLVLDLRKREKKKLRKKKKKKNKKKKKKKKKKSQTIIVSPQSPQPGTTEVRRRSNEWDEEWERSRRSNCCTPV